MSAQILLERLEESGITIQSFDELKNGCKLIEIANYLLYENSNDYLKRKSLQKQSDRAGNNVININTLLKHLKSQANLEIPQFVKQLTFFNILENQDKLIMFVEWMLLQSQNNYKAKSKLGQQQQQIQDKEALSSNRFKEIQINDSLIQPERDHNQNSMKRINGSPSHDENQHLQQEEPNEKEDNHFNQDFQNLYFASNLKEKVKNEDLELLSQGKNEQGQKIVRRGSFKLLKPKVNFSEQEKKSLSPKQLSDQKVVRNQQNPIINNIQLLNQPEELKQISMIQNYNMNMSNFIDYDQSQAVIEEQNRKTVLKHLKKPPLCRPSSKTKDKQNLENQKSYNPKKKAFFKNQQQNSYDSQAYFMSQKQQNQPNSKQNNKQIKMKQFYSQQISSSKKLINDSHDLHFNNQRLQNQLQELQRQIQKQNKSIAKIESIQHSVTDREQFNCQKFHLNDIAKTVSMRKNNISSSKKSRNSSHRKVFTFDIQELSDQEKLQIVQWLIKLGFIRKNNNSIQSIMEEFQDGVKFIQIYNYFAGRGKQIPYFKAPKRSAEIHSNFTRLFQHLKQIPNFSSQLLFQYQFFVQKPQQNAIWSLLNSIVSLFRTRSKNKGKRAVSQLIVDNRQEQIQKSVQRLSSLSKKNKTEKHIKCRNHAYQSSRQIEHSQEQPQTMTIINKFHSQDKKSRISLKSSKQQKINLKTQVQFIKEIPSQVRHKDLIQIDQPVQNQLYEHSSHIYDGYKEKYLKKSLSNLKQYKEMQTPKKPNIQGMNLSMNAQKQNNSQSKRKSYITSSLKKAIRQNKSNSKKNIHRQTSTLPKITLNMQMKVSKFLSYNNEYKQFDISSNQQLLKDPIRNGVLVNAILRSELSNQKQYSHLLTKFVANPKSIHHCRENYENALHIIERIIQIKTAEFPQKQIETIQNYRAHIQQILKGQKSLFYGIAFHILNLSGGFKRSLEPKQQPVIKNNNYGMAHFQQLEKQQQIIRQLKEDPITWIRFLQAHSHKISQMKIRSEQKLNQYINSGQLIYSIVLDCIKQNQNSFQKLNILKPVYDSAITSVQKQSNIKKVLSFMAQNHWIQAEHVQLSRNISRNSSIAIKKIMELLIELTFNSIRGDFIDRNEKVNKPITLIKHIKNCNESFRTAQENLKERLQTTTDQELQQDKNNLTNRVPKPSNYLKNRIKTEQVTCSQNLIEIPWIRKLSGFSTCSLSINNGIILCRLLSKLTRSNISINESVNLSKPECLSNIRKAIKLIPSCKWTELDIYRADQTLTCDIYQHLKDKFRNTYEMNKILSS